MKKKIFLMCPVRGASEETTRKIAAYVRKLEEGGAEVYWPARDTDQVDAVGVRICHDNGRALRKAGEVHIWYDAGSQGSIFDLGMFFMASVIIGPEKPFVIANPEDLALTTGKSFQNILLALASSEIKALF